MRWKNKFSVGSFVIVLALLVLIAGTVPGIGQEISGNEISTTISLDVKGMDIQDVLRLIAEKANVNIIAGSEVTGVVSMRLKNVELWQALDMILKSKGFTYRKEDGIVRVIPMEEAVEKKPVLKTEVIILKYAGAEETKKVAEHLLSSSGTLNVAPKTNALIVTDLPENVDLIKDLAKRMDVETPPKLEQERLELEYLDVAVKEQKDLLKEGLGNIIGKEGSFFIDSLTNSVYMMAPASTIEKVKQYIKGADVPPRRVMIKAEFVEVRVTELEEVGIRWRWLTTYDGYPLGGSFYHEMELGGDEGPLESLATGMGIMFGTTEEKVRGIIDFLLSEGKARLLSSPNVVTLENEQATIDVGDKHPYRVTRYVEGNWVEGIEFITVGATLVVTPRIKGDNQIVLDIHPEVSEVTGAAPFSGAPPIVGTREARSSIMVKDGETLVVGGLLRETEKESRGGVPYLSRIPLLGSIFTHKELTTEKTDLLVFITPHVLPEDMETEDMVQKRVPIKTQMEQIYRKGLAYKKQGQVEKAKEQFEQLAEKSRRYGFSTYFTVARRELAVLELMEEGKPLTEEDKAKIEKKLLEEGIVAEEVETLELEEESKIFTEEEERERMFALGAGIWLPSSGDDSFPVYEAQLKLGRTFGLFAGGGSSSETSANISYAGARIGDKLNAGIGGMQSDAFEEMKLMLTGGFSLGTETLRLEGSYVYVPDEDDAGGIKALVGIRF